jgi:hypothetical protein
MVVQVQVRGASAGLFNQLSVFSNSVEGAVSTPVLEAEAVVAGKQQVSLTALLGPLDTRLGRAGRLWDDFELLTKQHAPGLAAACDYPAARSCLLILLLQKLLCDDKIFSTRACLLQKFYQEKPLPFNSLAFFTSWSPPALACSLHSCMLNATLENPSPLPTPHKSDL